MMWVHEPWTDFSSSVFASWTLTLISRKRDGKYAPGHESFEWVMAHKREKLMNCQNTKTLNANETSSNHIKSEEWRQSPGRECAKPTKTEGSRRRGSQKQAAMMKLSVRAAGHSKHSPWMPFFGIECQRFFVKLERSGPSPKSYTVWCNQHNHTQSGIRIMDEINIFPENMPFGELCVKLCSHLMSARHSVSCCSLLFFLFSICSAYLRPGCRVNSRKEEMNDQQVSFAKLAFFHVSKEFLSL